MATEVDLIASYAGLLSLACICIYTGAFASLPVRHAAHQFLFSLLIHISSNFQTKKRAGRAENNTDSDDEDEDEQPELLSVEDAWLFPIVLFVPIRSRCSSSDLMVSTHRLDLWCYLAFSW